MALLAQGHADTIDAFPEGTRTAADAAAAIGCAVAQIAKSIVFRAAMRAAVVITSGANRVDRQAGGGGARRVAGAGRSAIGAAATGFAAGGVAPVGLLAPPMLLMDEDLLALDPIWAAAGSPMHVFRDEGEGVAGDDRGARGRG